MKMDLKLFVIFLLALSACARGPKTEKKSPLNYANGEHYQQTANILGVPVLERVEKQTKIKGQVIVKGQPFNTPLRFQKMALKNKDNVVLKTSTNSEGIFEFTGEIPNGFYRVELVSERYKAAAEVHVTAYENKDLLLVVE
ncbi:MAG: hypothetical protein AB7F59_03145 [Bdellovibrionales bacterium]